MPDAHQAELIEQALSARRHAVALRLERKPGESERQQPHRDADGDDQLQARPQCGVGVPEQHYRPETEGDRTAERQHAEAGNLDLKHPEDGGQKEQRQTGVVDGKDGHRPQAENQADGADDSREDRFQDG